MRKNLILLFLSLFLVLPDLTLALTNEEAQGKLEIEQLWVDRHNEKLPKEVTASVKALRRGNAHMPATLRQNKVAMKRLKLSQAPKNGVPVEKRRADGNPVPLVALYWVKTADHSFLIADYANELNELHSSSDIHMKVGLKYYLLFEGTGYRRCARVLTLGKDSPLFFEVGHFGGGTGVQKVLYTFNEKIKNLKDDLYDHPENVKAEHYIQEVLRLNVWREGFTLYRDADKDGTLEVLNCSQSEYPKELKAKLKDKYKLVDNDFGGAFRKAVMVYKWDGKKLKFVEMGDYYY